MKKLFSVWLDDAYVQWIRAKAEAERRKITVVLSDLLDEAFRREMDNTIPPTTTPPTPDEEKDACLTRSTNAS